MVYSIGRTGVYEIEPDSHVRGRDEVWGKVEFLHPDKVDRHAWARDHVLTTYGYPLVVDSLPKGFVWKSKAKLPPDYAFGNNRVMLVSARFRDLVERFEPGAHQFAPVSMYHSNAEAEPFDEFYWFICCNLIDSLDPAKTTFNWRGFYDERMEDGLRRGRWHFDVADEPSQTAVFDLNATGDRHLWRDPYLNARTTVYCSDAFGEALMAAELTGFGLLHYEQV